jgi:glycosyltransferase involved in cell wall biosynthesis
VRPDIILPYTLLPSVACGCVWRFTGAKGCFWNQGDTLGYRMGAFWERLAIRSVSGFVANGLHVGEYLHQTFAVPVERIDIILNGVSFDTPERGRNEWRYELGCGDTDLMVVMVANLHRQKDHATLLSAWRIVLDGLANQEGSAVLVLAGLKGETFRELTAMADHLDIAASVRFPGQVDDVSGLLEAADIGVFSSRSEGSPNGLLECMAAGLPVVATDIPGVREAIGEGFAEVLSPIGDVQALAKNLLWLAKSATARAQKGTRNRQRVLANFSTSEMVQRMVDLMEKCLRP